MKDIVIHILDSVCAKNNRDPEATSLIEAARTFGTVEPLSSALAAEKAACQAEMDKLKAQYEERIRELERDLLNIQEKNVSDAELKILRLIREKSAAEAAGYVKDIQDRDNLLMSTKNEYESKVAQIAAFLGI